MKVDIINKRDFLPKKVEVDGVYYKIDTDFRTALSVMDMYNDGALSAYDKHIIAIKTMYTTRNKSGKLVTNIPENIVGAAEALVAFLNGSRLEDESNEEVSSASEEKSKIPILDYYEDEKLLFSAVNKVAGKEVRAEKYMHWWTFIGLCSAIDDNSAISHIMSIRNKLLTPEGKESLTPEDKRYIKENKKEFERFLHREEEIRHKELLELISSGAIGGEDNVIPDRDSSFS